MSQQSKTLQIFLSHRVALLTYATRLTGDRAEAEDVLQEAWLRFGTAEQPLEEPSGYLYRIVRNLALDGRRRRGVENRVFREDANNEAGQVPSDAPSPEMSAISSDELHIALETLEEMPERMRIAVEMHRFGGAKLKDIAARLGISTTTAHGLVTEAIQICRSRLRRPS